MSATFMSGARAGYGAPASRPRNAASRNLPCSTSRKSRIHHPFLIQRARAGRCGAGCQTTDIGVMASCTDEKTGCRSPSGQNTGVITVMSGKCVPPAYGSFNATTSPGRSVPARDASTARTLSPIATKMHGWTCGAFATRLPAASKIAQEKSNLSLMLTLCATLRSNMGQPALQRA